MQRLDGNGGCCGCGATAALLALAITILAAWFLAQASSPVSAQSVTCDDFDSWVWAQMIHDSDPEAHADLDPDGDGVACDHLSVDGFAPVLWADSIPDAAEAAEVSSVTDGDTIKIITNGVEDTVRLLHIDAPETTNFGGGMQCGGPESSAYLEYVLSFAPDGIVYLEYDQTERDRFDRRLSYIWFQIGDDVYMVNEVMVRNGWAESDTYPPDDKYKEQLDEAEQFSVQKVLGVRLLCGRFGQETGSAPSGQQLREAQQRQPNQGQFEGIVAREQLDAQPTEVPQEAAAPVHRDGDCDPAYPTVCIPPYPPDLNCGDIEHRRFQVLPPDPHNFDGDFDGVGCERD